MAGLALAAPRVTEAAMCAGAGDPCPYGSVAVLGEGGDGVFRFAQALAISPDGRRVYVADQMGYRIQAFTRDGLFLRQWGRYGTGPGEIRAVGGLATDSAGRVFVLDSNNDRVQVFDPNGLLLGAWGSSGTAPGQFDLGSNGGLAIAGAMAFVADQDNHRIQRFTLDPATGMADAASVLTWGAFGDCATSCTRLNFNHPQGIAVNTVAGQPQEVFVADDDNHRVLKFDADGVPLGAIDAPGELGYPYDVGVDSTHALYVVDNCDPSFVPVCSYSTGDRTDLTHQRVRKYDAGSLSFLATWGVFGDQPGQFEFPRAAAAVTADPAGGVYVAEAANNRVQAFDANGRFQRKWGLSGRGPGYLTRPAAVASDADGNIYVADTSSDRIQQFSADGRYRGEWDRLSTTGYPAAGGGLGEFRDPAGVTVGRDGTVYVADTGNNRLQARDPATGTWRQLGGVTLRAPRGLAIDAGGRLYVADTGANLVRVLDLERGQWSTVDRTFSAPRAVAVDASGNLYVADTGAGRVRVRDAESGTWTDIGVNQLLRPAGVTIAGSDIVVADTGHDRVVRFSAEGALAGAWGARGTDDGQFDGPQGVAVDSSGRLLVADEFNNRVQIFAAAPALTPTPTPSPSPTPAATSSPAATESPTSTPQPQIAPGPTTRAASTAPTALSLSVVAVRRAAAVRLRLACSRACLASVRLRLAARSSSGRPVTVAARDLRIPDARPRLIRLTLRPPALRRAGQRPLRLVVSGVDASGSRARVDRRL